MILINQYIFLFVINYTVFSDCFSVFLNGIVLIMTMEGVMFLIFTNKINPSSFLMKDSMVGVHR